MENIENYIFLNYLFSKASNLISLNLNSNELNSSKLKNVNFELIPKQLEELDLGKNESLEDMNFLNIIFRNTQLKKLFLN